MSEKIEVSVEALTSLLRQTWCHSEQELHQRCSELGIQVQIIDNPKAFGGGPTLADAYRTAAHDIVISPMGVQVNDDTHSIVDGWDGFGKSPLIQELIDTLSEMTEESK